MLTNVRQVKTTLRGGCNAGVTTSTIKGTLLGMFNILINTYRIVNLLSIPQLEDDGYIAKYNTRWEYAILTPEGRKTVFRRETDLCNQTPYIDIRQHKDAFALL